MHALAQTYQLTNPAWRRPQWNDAGFDFPTMYLPAAEGLALQKYREVRAYLNGLPKDSASYGLIHLDAHPSNLFITPQGKLTLFDFDETAYSWFINDIAIVLFYVVMDAQDWPAYTREFMVPFLRGYQKANLLDASWLKEIPYFLKLRELELYAVMFRDFDVDNIEDEWCARFMKGRKAKIESDAPFIDFDFTSLLKA
jgi:Ser/Thr protein kinase RdoA (MazF antagonist)